MKRFILTLGVIAMMLPAGAILAQSDTRNDMGTTYDKDIKMTITGTIVSIDATSLVVRTDDGRTMTFTRDSDSDVDKDLLAGQPVKVEYHAMAGGTYHLADASKATDEDRAKYGAGTTTTRTGDDAGISTGSTTTGTTTTTTNPNYNNTTTTGTTGTTTTGTYDNRTSTTTTTGTTYDNTRTRSTTMPSTASPIPLVGLAGLLALGAGLGVRAYLRH